MSPTHVCEQLRTRADERSRGVVTVDRRARLAVAHVPDGVDSSVAYGRSQWQSAGQNVGPAQRLIVDTSRDPSTDMIGCRSLRRSRPTRIIEYCFGPTLDPSSMRASTTGTADGSEHNCGQVRRGRRRRDPPQMPNVCVGFLPCIILGWTTCPPRSPTNKR